MAHYAKIENGIVVTVEVLNNEVILDENNVEQESTGIAFIHNLYNDDTTIWVQTSYNNNFRKNYAGIGHTYDETRDAFYAPQPYASWVLNETTCIWESPIGNIPTLNSEQQDQNTAETHSWRYVWNEENQTWDLTNIN